MHTLNVNPGNHIQRNIQRSWAPRSSMDLQQKITAIGSPEAEADTPLSNITHIPPRIDISAGSDREVLAMRQHLCWRNVEEHVDHRLLVEFSPGSVRAGVFSCLSRLLSLLLQHFFFIVHRAEGCSRKDEFQVVISRRTRCCW